MRPFRYISIVLVLLLLLLDLAYFAGQASVWWIVIVLVIYVHLLVLGAIYIRWNFYMKSYNSGPDKKYVALTFDDGPAAQTAAILDILKKEKVPAAFFTIGKNTVAHPELVRRWHEEGHLIGNHSYNHGFNFDWQRTKTMQAEIAKTNEAVAQITGVRPRLFRPPYGVTNPNLARAVQRSGMYSIGWNLRSFDTTAKDPDLLLRKILHSIKGGDIILLHDSMAVTKEILTSLITETRKKGFTFIRVDKMLDIKAYE